MPNFLCLTLALLATLVGGACNVGGDSGIDPPFDRVFLPSGAVLDGTGRWLLVVNSNSDLRYSFGTLLPLDLAAVREDLNKPWPVCPAADYRPLRNEGRVCCRDPLDVRVLNCDDRPYALASATVQVGSFAATPVVQAFERDGQNVNRVFFGVRADPSVTFVDVTLTPAGVNLRCTGNALEAANPPAKSNPRCDKNFRVETGVLDGLSTLLPEEPFALTLDNALGVLYVGHLFAGLSAVDVCAPERGIPRLAAVVPRVYVNQNATGVTSVTPGTMGDPLSPIFTTARAGAVIGQVFFRAGAEASACNPAAPRDLALVPSAPLPASTFEPRGTESRGFVYQPSQQRAFVLHRNSSGNPAALARMALGVDSRQRPQLEPSLAIDVCAGPAELHLHNAGRGDRLYIPCFESGQVYVVDPDLMVVTNVIEAGRGPASLTFHTSDPTTAYITGYVDNNISVLDLRPGSITEGRVVQRIGFPRTSRQL